MTPAGLVGRSVAPGGPVRLGQPRVRSGRARGRIVICENDGNDSLYGMWRTALVQPEDLTR